MESAAQAWLSLLSTMIPGAVRTVVFLGQEERGPYVPVGQWPERAQAQPALAEAAQQAMAERRNVVLPSGVAGDDVTTGPRLDAVATPILRDGRLLGAVVVELPHRAKVHHRPTFELLRWGSTWLQLLIAQGADGGKQRLVTALELVATGLEHSGFQGAATAVVTELATRLGLERVSFGLRKGHRVVMRALSHSARFGERTHLARDIEAAMDEAADQETRVLYPAAPGAAPQLAVAHGTLVRDHGCAAVCSVPFTAADGIGGVFTFEAGSREALDGPAVALCEHAASLLGPILALRWRDDESWVARALHAGRRQLRELSGPGHITRKVVVGATAVALAVVALVPSDYRIAADATLEGTVQRAVVAAVEGYVLEADARAGDVVRAGDTLALLDDRDLQLERRRLVSQRAQTEQEHREALAGHDRTQVSILSAQIAQAEARLALVEEQLARTRLTAPFDGVVVKGDLSQSLGSPVERGEVLFEIAPLDDYRIIVEVDERDIADVAVGQRGRLALSSMPGDPLHFAVERITPVSVAEEGSNFFRVEARLAEPSDALRPGMEGVAKITAGRRPLLWIWTHRLVDSIRLALWSWWP